MRRLSLLALLVLAASDLRAQPAEIVEIADNYVISVQYREAPSRAADGLHMAYVTVRPVTSRPRALWSGTLRAVRLSATSDAHGVVWLRQTERGHYAGYGSVPAPAAIAGVSFAGSVDEPLAAYDLNPNDLYYDSQGGKDKDGGGKTDPGTGGDTGGDKGGDTGTDPGGDDDLVNPWDPDPEPTQPTKPKPEWPENPGDDLVNPWPGRKAFFSSAAYFTF